MTWKKEVFGSVPSGEEVYKYTLTNAQGASAAFTDLGGVWLEMIVPDRNGRMDDVLLGWGTVRDIMENGGHLGEPIGRCANRIGGAQFELNGRTYKLKANSGRNNIHSGDDFFRNRVWRSAVSEDASGIRISFSLTSPDGDQGYPGNAEITVSYTLSDDNSLRLDYHMTSDADTIANFTNHAYFNLAGHTAGGTMSHVVWIDADSWTVAAEDSVPTGEIAPVAGTPLDFTVPKPIGQDIDADFGPLRAAGGYDHNYVLNHAPGVFALSASVRDGGSGRLMEVYTDLPGIQFYTGNGLKPFLSKDGAYRYSPRDGYCFETQYFPDAVNKPDFPGPVLSRGEEYRTSTVYKFSVI